MEIMKIAILGVAGVLLALILKETKPEYATMTVFAAGLVILILAGERVNFVFAALNELQSYLPMETSCLSLLFRMMGVAYLGKFSSDICKDAGYPSIGNQIELFSKLSILSLSMPILQALFTMMQELLG